MDDGISLLFQGVKCKMKRLWGEREPVVHNLTNSPFLLCDCQELHVIHLQPVQTKLDGSAPGLESLDCGIFESISCKLKRLRLDEGRDASHSHWKFPGQVVEELGGLFPLGNNLV